MIVASVEVKSRQTKTKINRRCIMDLVKWNRDIADPFKELDRIQDEINRIFDFPRFSESEGIFDRAVSPALDVVENTDNYIVRCDLPGVEQKNLEVSVEGDVLTLSLIHI